MTPFLQFRIWYRRASAGSRVSAALAAAAALALLVWAAVPSSRSASSVAFGSNGLSGNPTPAGGSPGAGPAVTNAAGGAAAANTGGLSTAGATGGGGAGGAVPTGAGSGAAPGGGATSAAAGAAAGSAAGTGGATSGGSTGQTAAGTGGCSKMGQLKVGVVVPEGAGGSLNTVIGNPATSQEEADYAAVLDSVNKAGGVDCYDLVGDFVASDLTNPSSAASGCNQLINDKVFAVLGGFEPSFSDDCLLQAHVPTFDELPIPTGDVKTYFPYYFSTYPSYETLYGNFAGAANQMGYFGPAKGFAKMGVLYKDCTKETNQAMLAALAAYGVSGAKVDTFDLGCAGEFTDPGTVQEGILKFKTDGVTTATIDNDIPDIKEISTAAQQDNFHPKWIVPDYGEVAVSNNPALAPDSTNFDNAVAITAGQYGAIASNLPETPGTVACDKIMTSHNLPTVYQSGDQFAGSTCSLVWMLVAAIQKGGPSQTALVAGLQAAKTVQTSFPNGPNDFSTPGTTTGGEYWRPLVYVASCPCWKVSNPNWSPSFR